MSANTMPDSPSQVSPAGTPPANMPPPPPGTGLTTGPIPTSAPAAQPRAPAPVQTAPAPAPAAPAPAAPDAKAHKAEAKAAKAKTKADGKAARPASGAGDAPFRPTTSTSAGTRLGGRLLIGVIWGPLAIGAAALLQMWDSAIGGDLAIRPLRLMTTLLEGGAGLVDGPVWLGIAVNVVIGVVLGILFGLIAGRFGTPRGILVGALVLGAGVFAVDWLLVTPQLPLLGLRDEVLLLASRLLLGAVLAIGFIGIADRRA